ncbi:hypothetical protein YB2330_003929 [Saitoella coloradoensis]
MPKRKLPSTSTPTPTPTPSRDPRTTRREATLYDALADRVTYNGFTASHKRSSKPKRPSHTSSSSGAGVVDTLDGGAGARRTTTTFGLLAKNNHPLPPDLVLRHRKHAPLAIPVPSSSPPELPDPDLLFALHQYASDLYDRTRARNGRVGLGSMDETALLALGCLVEEEVRGVVGGGVGVFLERGVVGDVYGGIGEGGAELRVEGEGEEEEEG